MMACQNQTPRLQRQRQRQHRKTKIGSFSVLLILFCVDSIVAFDSRSPFAIQQRNQKLIGSRHNNDNHEIHRHHRNNNNKMASSSSNNHHATEEGEEQQPWMLQQQQFPRRDFLVRQAFGSSAVVVLSNLLLPAVAAEAADEGEEFVRRGDKFAYSFVPPPGMKQGSKPLKTHLDEINFSSETVPKYQIGITVDPVRIKSLKEFGTPEQVAAKVVTAEINRDGIFDVTLMKDAIETSIGDTVVYQLNYLSSGKRGKKRFVANFCIQNERLYALTAQATEDSYPELENEMMKSVNSFRVFE